MSELKRAVMAVIAIAALCAPAFAGADPVKVAGTVPFGEAVSRLTTAVEKAGAQVFAVVNYAEGVASVGGTLRPTTLVIFGNPKIGASALEVGQTMGLYLPLRELAYEDEAGKTWLIYNDPANAAADHGIPKDHPAVVRMQGALVKFTGIAAGN